ncbi:MAG: hypothetical protein ACJ72O_10955 [Marmoricola sp.]
MTRPPNTPGIVGYAAGIGVSCVLFGLLFMLPSLQFYDVADGLAVLALYVPMCALAAASFGVLAWAPATLLLHVSCRSVSVQAVHVVVAGLLGAVAARVPLGIVHVGYGSRTYDVLVVGISAALGRAAVVPLVISRRRLAAQGHLTGTARW